MKDGRPNIFNFATQELSQDAVVCWLLKCSQSQNAKYKQVGMDFIRFALQDQSLEEYDIELSPQSPYKQRDKMDVYAEIRVRDEIVPVIFEDKTKTYLHSNQFINYCTKVNGWLSDKKYLIDLCNSFNREDLKWGNIVYVYYKLGYTSGWRKNDFDVQAQAVKQKIQNIVIKEIYIDDMLEFVKQHNYVDLLEDYEEFLTKESDRIRNALENWNDYENIENYSGEGVYWTEAAADMLYQKIFGENTQFHYDSQCWSSKEILKIRQDDNKENDISYSIRFSSFKHKESKENRHAFCIQQYREDNNHRKSESLKEARKKEAEIIRNICSTIFDELGFKEYELISNAGMPAQNNLFKIFIFGKENTAEKVCDVLCEFVKLFKKEVTEKFGERVIITD